MPSVTGPEPANPSVLAVFRATLTATLTLTLNLTLTLSLNPTSTQS